MIISLLCNKLLRNILHFNIIFLQLYGNILNMQYIWSYHCYVLHNYATYYMVISLLYYTLLCNLLYGIVIIM